MKANLLLLMLLTLLQNQGFGQVDTLVIKKEDYDNIKQTTDEYKLVGIWELYYYYKSYGKWRQCRECPYIFFYDSQIANVVLDSNITEKYIWSIDSNKIKFELVEGPINSPLISNLAYSFNISEREKGLTLLLFSGDLEGFAFIKK